MSFDLITKHRLITEFALNVYSSKMSAQDISPKAQNIFQIEISDHEIKKAISHLDPKQQRDAREILNLGSKKRRTFATKQSDYKAVMAVCARNPNLCHDPQMDPIWKIKIIKDCYMKFRGHNLRKFKNIAEFNQHHRSGFRNFFHIYELCNIIPATEDELVGKIFVHVDPKLEREVNFIQVAGLTDKGLIVRKVPHKITYPIGAIKIVHDQEWVTKYPIKEMESLSKKQQQTIYTDYFHILKPAEFKDFRKLDFYKRWFIHSSKYGTFKLPFLYY